MKRKYKAYLKLNIMSLFFLAGSFLSITLAWFAYSGLARAETDIKVKSWYIEFQKDSKKVSNDIIISLEDIYPGMDAIHEKIDIKNLGDSDAQVNYSISSARIFNEELDTTTSGSLILEDKMSHDYPFHININLSKKYVKAEDDSSELNVSVTWPLDSDNDSLDSSWGTEAFNFQKEEEEKLKSDPNYQIRSSIKIVINLKAEQYITSNDSIDMFYNLGDTVLYDVKDNKICKEISDTCIKSYILDVDNKVGDSSVRLLPDLFNTYQAGTYDEYDNLLRSISSYYNVTVGPLRAEDLLNVISTDILNSYFVREKFSNEIIGNLGYNNRASLELDRAREKKGTYEFLNSKFPYLATNKCYWVKDEYDSESAFALTKKDNTVSKIYNEAKTNSCNVVPVITVSKANLYSG